MFRNIILCFATAVILSSCSTSYPKGTPVGKVFPEVTATALSGPKVELPSELPTEETVILVGFVQKSQFDIDRWILGLLQLDTPVKIFEVPTITSSIAGLFRSSIDEGMRRGIPRKEWPIVLTVYDDAEKIARFLGTTNERNAHVVLLDENGKVLWFHNDGFSPQTALELDKLVKERRGNN